jgi:hypothetical protein
MAESSDRAAVIFWNGREKNTHRPAQSQVIRAMSLNDLEFAYAPVRNQVRDLREYL